MKILLLLSIVVATVNTSVIPSVSVEDLTVYGYHRRVGVPHAELIKNSEESAIPESSRIIGGSPANVGQLPYQVGLLINLIDGRISVCGASLITINRSVTAAHCWYDGEIQAFVFEVILGSVTLFTGGTRIFTSEVIMHELWNPLAPSGRFTNDVAIFNHQSINPTALIQPIALPSGAELNNDFNGANAIASGFGVTSDWQGISQNQFLSFVNLNIIDNNACRMIYADNIIDSTICTSGSGRVGTCGGDSGGPLALQSNGRPILVGIVNFGTIFCSIGTPSAYARATHFTDWIQSRLK